MGNDFILKFIIYGFVAIIVLAILCSIPRMLKRKRLKRYESIYIDMPEEEMLGIMGKGYNKSTLKNNTQKYEWRINATSSGYSRNGVSTRSYSGVRKVDIYVKEGKVIEIKPYNV